MLICSGCVIAISSRLKRQSPPASSKESSTFRMPNSPHWRWWVHYIPFRFGTYQMAPYRQQKSPSIMHVFSLADLLLHSICPTTCRTQNLLPPRLDSSDLSCIYLPWVEKLTNGLFQKTQ